MIVAVGSTNPTKINPVKDVFSRHFSDITVTAVNVKSGVSNQPMHVDEMYKGALNRAKAALKKVQGAQYGVGIEGGIHKYKHGWFEQSLVVIINRKGDIGIGSSGGLVLPSKIMREIQKGKTLEEAVDTHFGTKRIGEGIGMFGIFTNNVVSRTEGVKHGVAFAVARFLHAHVYDN